MAVLSVVGRLVSIVSIVLPLLFQSALSFTSSLPRPPPSRWSQPVHPYHRVFLQRPTLELIPVSREGLNDTPHLTIIVPAYNEERRLPRMIEAYTKHLAQSDRWSDPKKVNFVVVNDGSTDSTENFCKELIESQGESVSFTHVKYSISLMSLPYNQGKGAALAAAIDRINDARGLVLTTDADGSAEITCLDVLFDKMVATLQPKASSEMDHLELSWTDPAVVCGYRTYSDTATGRLLFRWGFRAVVRLVCGDLGTRDSQCGFKLMTVTAAKQLYRNLHLTRWSHDVEVLYRAKLLNYAVTEAPVKWQDVDGSKLKAEGIVKVAFRMFLDVCRCRLYYALGIWNILDIYSIDSCI